MRTQLGPIGEPGDVVTAEMVRSRILAIADMVVPGETVAQVTVEMEYLIAQLHTVHS